MNELGSRLTAVFRAAFPGLREANIANATRDSVENWDSVASVTLSTLVEEEFGSDFNLEDAAEWTSFRQVYAALEKRLGG